MNKTKIDFNSFGNNILPFVTGCQAFSQVAKKSTHIFIEAQEINVTSPTIYQSKKNCTL